MPHVIVRIEVAEDVAAACGGMEGVAGMLEIFVNDELGLPMPVESFEVIEVDGPVTVGTEPPDGLPA